MGNKSRDLNVKLVRAGGEPDERVTPPNIGIRYLLVTDLRVGKFNGSACNCGAAWICDYPRYGPGDLRYASGQSTHYGQADGISSARHTTSRSCLRHLLPRCLEKHLALV